MTLVLNLPACPKGKAYRFDQVCPPSSDHRRLTSGSRPSGDAINTVCRRPVAVTSNSHRLLPEGLDTNCRLCGRKFKKATFVVTRRPALVTVRLHEVRFVGSLRVMTPAVFEPSGGVWSIPASVIPN